MISMHPSYWFFYSNKNKAIITHLCFVPMVMRLSSGDCSLQPQMKAPSKNPCFLAFQAKMNPLQNISCRLPESTPSSTLKPLWFFSRKTSLPVTETLSACFFLSLQTKNSPANTFLPIFSLFL